MSKPVPLQNSSAAAYLEIENSEVSYSPDSGPGGRPLATVTIGGSTGQKGQSTALLAQGLNVLSEDEYKKCIIKLEDDSIITSATVEFPGVTDDYTEAYKRNVWNTSDYDVVITNGVVEGDFILGAGLSMDLAFSSIGVRAADNQPSAVNMTSVTMDWARGNVFEYDLADGVNTIAFENHQPGMTRTLILNGAATSEVAFDEDVAWMDGAQPVQTPDGTDVYTFVHGVNTIFGAVVQSMSVPVP